MASSRSALGALGSSVESDGDAVSALTLLAAEENSRKLVPWVPASAKDCGT